MITLLRKIRRRLLSQNNFTSYLLYAIGEILLVVVGILIALQINNWNINRTNRITEYKLLEELKSNLIINSDRLQEQVATEKKCFNSSKIIVKHLDNKLAYHDSLAFHFEWACFSPDIVISNSAFEAIKSKGFDIIGKDNLRRSIIELYDNNYAVMIRNTVGLEDLFWPSVTLPLVVKHLRDQSTEEDWAGLRPIDYNKLLQDSEFTSMLEKRGIFRRMAAELKSESLRATQELLDQIDMELSTED